ncbi:GNAT family N-acetyltransferase [Microbacterium testaceum]|nr:GNAT family N-acetyltransferase [Microbacterium testaceum]
MGLANDGWQPRRVHSDADRERIREFYQRTMGDPTGWDVLTREQDRQLGLPSGHLVAEDENGTLAGCIYFSADPEDVLDWRSRGEDELADTIASDVMMIHQMAVAQPHRRKGLGTALLLGARDAALGAGAALMLLALDDTQDGLADFYDENNYVVVPRGRNIAVTFHSFQAAAVRFPQSVPSHRWAYQVLSSRRVAVDEIA